MKTDSHTSQLFKRLSVRRLAAWLFLGLILIMPVYSALILYYGYAIGGLLSIGFLTVWPAFWIVHQLGKSGVALRGFIGRLPRPRRWGRWTLITIGAGVFSMGCVYLIWYPLSFLSPDALESMILTQSAYAVEDGTPKPLGCILLEFALAVIAAPFAEELMFRGVIFQRWTLKWGMRKGIVWSSLAFGIIHPDLLGAVFGRYVMAVLYVRTGSLWVPMFCHALHNAAGYLVEGIVLLSGQPAIPTIEEFHDGLWFGVVCFLSTAPWVIWFVVKNWPARSCRVPYLPKATSTGNGKCVASPEID